MNKIKFHLLFLLLASLSFLILYDSDLWGALVNFIVKTQLQFHKLLNAQILLIAQDSKAYGLGLIGISFIYGVFHSLGPGHGKLIIVSYLSSNPQSKTTSCLLALVAALFQAISAILLVTILSIILEYKFVELAFSANQLGLIGYSLLLCLGLFIGIRSLNELRKYTAGHTACSSCCASANVKTKGKSVYQLFLIAIAIGIRPCSGALIILVSSSMLGIYNYGILGTLAMSFGTALCTCVIALASLYARNFLNQMVAVYANANQQKRYGLYIQLAGSVVIICLALSLINANNLLINPLLSN